MEDIAPAAIDRVCDSVGVSAEIRRALQTCFRKARRSDPQISAAGAQNLLDQPEFHDLRKLRSILRIVEEQKVLYDLIADDLAHPTATPAAHIGAELGAEEMAECSVVTVPYRFGDRGVGLLAILGPRRMPYGRLMSLAAGTAQSLGTYLGQRRNSITRADRLLRNPRRTTDGARRRHQTRVPPTRAQVPSRRCGRQSRGRDALQGNQRSLRSALRSAEACELRSLRPRRRPRAAVSAALRPRASATSSICSSASSAPAAALRARATDRNAAAICATTSRSRWKKRSRARSARSRSGIWRPARRVRAPARNPARWSCRATAAVRRGSRGKCGRRRSDSSSRRRRAASVRARVRSCRRRVPFAADAAAWKPTSTLSVKIPAGVDDGSRIRLSGSGEAGLRNGPDGDLYVYLSVKKHEFFRRDGLHIFAEVPIGFPTAALGGEIRVTALDGEHTLQIPAGTQTGAQFRLRGHGMPAVRGGVRGDHLVTVRLVVPTKLGQTRARTARRVRARQCR